MLMHMRTTINLPDELYRATKVRAAADGRTVTSILEEALRTFLDEPPAERPADYRVRPLRGAPVPADVPLDDNAALRDLMDASDADR